MPQNPTLEPFSHQIRHPPPQKTHQELYIQPCSNCLLQLPMSPRSLLDQIRSDHLHNWISLSQTRILELNHVNFWKHRWFGLNLLLQFPPQKATMVVVETTLSIPLAPFYCPKSMAKLSDLDSIASSVSFTAFIIFYINSITHPFSKPYTISFLVLLWI